MAIYLVGGGPESCPTPGLLDGFRDEVAAHGGPLVVVMVERENVLEEFLPRYRRWRPTASRSAPW